MKQIPFVSQGDPAKRRCGAAALCMALHYFDKPVTLDEVWEKIKIQKETGGWYTESFKIAEQASRYDLDVLILRAKDTRLLNTLDRPNVCVILNHLLDKKSKSGHYTVMLGVSGLTLRYHDSQYGKNKSRTIVELMSIWRKSGNEISGKVLIALTNKEPSGWCCQLCQTTIPKSTNCPHCNNSLRLHPLLLNCVNDSCKNKLWEQIICHYCDKSFILSQPLL